jgi:hypothetical protein
MWVGSPLLLLMLVLVLLMLVRLVGGVMMIHHPILRRGTTRQSCHNLPLFSLLVGVDRIAHNDNVANEFWE